MSEVDTISIPPVIVFWNDAWGEDASVSLKDIDNNPVLTATHGWLLVDDDVGVSLGMDKYPSSPKDFRNTAHIPSGMITKIVYLKE